MKKILLSAVCLTGLLFASQADAYYSTSSNNTQEWYEVGTNQSVFVVPMVGNTKDSQGQFNSAEFLNTKKVPDKRIEIPHVQIHTPGLTTSDYWVPAAKVFVVTRAPYERIWTGKGSGSNANIDQRMHGDTADGINISVDITISASIREEDTATFLYNFPPQTGSTAAVSAKSSDEQLQANFASVVYGAKLADIMDTIVWAAVQAEFSNQFGILRITNIEAEKIKAIKAVDKNIKDMFATKGITIGFVGLASGINYDNPAVQKAMDDLAIADMEAAKTVKLMPTLDYQRQMAGVNMTNGLAMAMQKWNGSAAGVMPQIMSTDAFANLMTTFRGFLTPAAPPAGK